MENLRHNNNRFTGERVTNSMTLVTLQMALIHLLKNDRKPLGEYILAQEHLGRYRVASYLCMFATRVLDDAGGEGYGSRLIKELGKPHQVVSIDIDLPALQSAKLAHSERVDFANADAQTLPFDDDSFPAVVSFETIEHLRHPETFIAETARVLTPNGILVISTPNREISNPDISRYDPPKNPYHVFELTEQEFRDDLEKYFDQVTILGQHFGVKPFGQKRTAIDRLKNFVSVLTGESFKIRNFSRPQEEPAYFVAICRNPKKTPA